MINSPKKRKNEEILARLRSGKMLGITIVGIGLLLYGLLLFVTVTDVRDGGCRSAAGTVTIDAKVTMNGNAIEREDASIRIFVVRTPDGRCPEDRLIERVLDPAYNEISTTFYERSTGSTINFEVVIEDIEPCKFEIVTERNVDFAFDADYDEMQAAWEVNVAKVNPTTAAIISQTSTECLPSGI